MEKAPYLEAEEIGGEEFSQLLVKPCNNNTLQEDKEGVRINLLIVPSISSTDLLPASVFCNIHPLVANLLPVKIKELPKAGRMKHFVKNWQRLTNNPMILDLVNGYKIPFILLPKQSRLPNLCQLTKEASDLMDQEVQDMLRKGAIVVSQLFVSCEKKDGGNRPVVNLKDLNKYIPYQHFNMKGLFLLKEMLLLGDKMCKIDLKDTYFAIPLSVKSKQYVRFQWKSLL